LKKKKGCQIHTKKREKKRERTGAYMNQYKVDTNERNYKEKETETCSGYI
jgi:hypothetical protein